MHRTGMAHLPTCAVHLCRAPTVLHCHSVRLNALFTTHKCSFSQHLDKRTDEHPAGPLKKYSALVQAGTIERDEHQLKAIAQLQRVFNELTHHAPPPASSWKSMLPAFLRPKQHKAVHAPKGLYLHGGVGCGKTMMMDLFFDAVPVKAKKRVHFHTFMLDVHRRMHALKKSDTSISDPIPGVAQEMMREAWLLCFDEFQVTDVGDAMILRRLFDQFFNMGVVMVATSNRPPDDLYKGGLQRFLFLPFIDLLKQRCHVHCLDSPTDYRMLGELGHRVYLYPISAANTAELTRLHTKLLGDVVPVAMKIKVMMGRSVAVPSAGKAVARFSFADLCGQPLGAADYLAVCSHFGTVVIDGIPQLNFERRDEARRLLTLIDTLYENKTKLLCTAQSEAGQLFAVSSGDRNEELSVATMEVVQALKTTTDMALFTGEDEIFAFQRAVSRLGEMQSADYLQAMPHHPPAFEDVDN